MLSRKSRSPRKAAEAGARGGSAAAKKDAPAVALRDQSTPAATSPVVEAAQQSPCTLQNLCPEDKQKISKLLKQIVDLGKENEQLKSEQAKAREAVQQAEQQAAEAKERERQAQGREEEVRARADKLNDCARQLARENVSLKGKLSQMLTVLRTYQERVHLMDSTLRQWGPAAPEQPGAASQPHPPAPESQPHPAAVPLPLVTTTAVPSFTTATQAGQEAGQPGPDSVAAAGGSASAPAAVGPASAAVAAGAAPGLNGASTAMPAAASVCPAVGGGACINDDAAMASGRVGGSSFAAAATVVAGAAAAGAGSLSSGLQVPLKPLAPQSLVSFPYGTVHITIQHSGREGGAEVTAHAVSPAATGETRSRQVAAQRGTAATGAEPSPQGRLTAAEQTAAVASASTVAAQAAALAEGQRGLGPSSSAATLGAGANAGAGATAKTTGANAGGVAAVEPISPAESGAGGAACAVAATAASNAPQPALVASAGPVAGSGADGAPRSDGSLAQTHQHPDASLAAMQLRTSGSPALLEQRFDGPLAAAQRSDGSLAAAQRSDGSLGAAQAAAQRSYGSPVPMDQRSDGPLAAAQRSDGSLAAAQAAAQRSYGSPQPMEQTCAMPSEDAPPCSPLLVAPGDAVTAAVAAHLQQWQLTQGLQPGAAGTAGLAPQALRFDPAIGPHGAFYLTDVAPAVADTAASGPGGEREEALGKREVQRDLAEGQSSSSSSSKGAAAASFQARTHSPVEQQAVQMQQHQRQQQQRKGDRSAGHQGSWTEDRPGISVDTHRQPLVLRHHRVSSSGSMSGHVPQSQQQPQQSQQPQQRQQDIVMPAAEGDSAEVFQAGKFTPAPSMRDMPVAAPQGTLSSQQQLAAAARQQQQQQQQQQLPRGSASAATAMNGQHSMRPASSGACSAVGSTASSSAISMLHMATALEAMAAQRAWGEGAPKLGGAGGKVPAGAGWGLATVAQGAGHNRAAQLGFQQQRQQDWQQQQQQQDWRQQQEQQEWRQQQQRSQEDFLPLALPWQALAEAGHGPGPATTAAEGAAWQEGHGETGHGLVDAETVAAAVEVAAVAAVAAVEWSQRLASASAGRGLSGQTLMMAAPGHAHNSAGPGGWPGQGAVGSNRLGAGQGQSVPVQGVPTLGWERRAASGQGGLSAGLGEGWAQELAAWESHPGQGRAEAGAHQGSSKRAGVKGVDGVGANDEHDALLEILSQVEDLEAELAGVRTTPSRPPHFSAFAPNPGSGHSSATARAYLPPQPPLGSGRSATGGGRGGGTSGTRGPRGSGNAVAQLHSVGAKLNGVGGVNLQGAGLYEENDVVHAILMQEKAGYDCR